MKDNRQGFSLIELLIVIIMLAIIAIIAIPNLLAAKRANNEAYARQKLAEAAFSCRTKPATCAAPAAKAGYAFELRKSPTGFWIGAAPQATEGWLRTGDHAYSTSENELILAKAGSTAPQSLEEDGVEVITR